MIRLSSSVLRPRWWWCGVDVRRWWQPCFDDDRWGRRQIIAAVSNSLFPFPVSRFIATWLVPRTPRLSAPSDSSFPPSPPPHLALRLHTSLHLPTSSENPRLPLPLVCLAVCFSLSLHLSDFQKEKAGSFSPLSDRGLMKGGVDVAIKLSEIIILPAITPGSSLHPAAIRRDSMTLTSA